MSEQDEFFSNSLDSVDGPSDLEMLLASPVAKTIASFGVNALPTTDFEAEDPHKYGHLFNKLDGKMYCACEGECCNLAVAGKHFPACICPECECDK